MTASENTEFPKFKSALQEKFGGKREITLSGKVSS